MPRRSTPLARTRRIRAKSKRMVKVAKLDALWSRVVRQRAGWKCIIPGCTGKTQGCHVLPKGAYPSLRHDPHNGFAACWTHHLGPGGWHKDPLMMNRILVLLEAERGPAYMEGLRIKALSQRAPDRTVTHALLESELDRFVAA